jgi:hypothetical protein
MQKEKRSFDYNWKVFTKDDIRRIAQVLQNSYQEAQEDERHSSLAYEIHCDGNISYESDSMSIFEDDGLMDTKKTLAIQMYFVDYEEQNKIDFTISNNRYHRNLTVRGTENNWVQGTFTTLKEIIDSVQPQTKFTVEYGNLILFFIALGVGSVIFLLLEVFVYSRIGPIQNPTGFIKIMRDFFSTYPWAGYLIDIFLRLVMGISTFAFRIYWWLLELWPEIEFDFGPEHLKIHKIRRQRMWAVISLIVIPILLGVVFEYFR